VSYHLKPPSKARSLKRFGQHFLASPAIARRIVEAAGIAPDDAVLEIGPGRGMLTDLLAERAGYLVAVELDRNLARDLAVRYHRHTKVRIIQGDFLKIDWQFLGLAQDRGSIAVGNLPYNVAVPILEKLLERARMFKRMVIMVQREVAERMAAGPGNREYGALSVFVQSQARILRLFDVRPGSFLPPPKVMSTVVELRPLAAPLVPEAEADKFYGLVRACFSYRRKTLGACLKHVLDGRGTAEARSGLKGIDLGRRAEQLGIDEFLTLDRELTAVEKQTC
jgi:16S rRNA (adenine1518-N6/adenine1519-N6)-dimethyltransferase